MRYTLTLKNTRHLTLKLFGLVFICRLLVANDAHAGTLPVRKGKLLLSASISYLHATRLWDKNGKVADYPDTGYYRSLGAYLYAEYGASRRVTIVGSIPFIRNTFVNKSSSTTSSGLGDAEFGARLYLGNVDFRYYLALQATMVVPLYMNSSTTVLGYQSFGSDAKIIGSGSANLGGETTCFYNLEFGARQYFAGGGPFQTRATASFGFNIDKQNQISLSAFGVKSVSTNKSFSGNLVQNKDFSYLQASLSVGHTFSRNFSAFANYNQFLVGRNMGVGTNISLSFIKRF